MLGLCRSCLQQMLRVDHRSRLLPRAVVNVSDARRHELMPASRATRKVIPRASWPRGHVENRKPGHLRAGRVGTLLWRTPQAPRSGPGLRGTTRAVHQELCRTSSASKRLPSRHCRKLRRSRWLSTRMRSAAAWVAEPPVELATVPHGFVDDPVDAKRNGNACIDRPGAPGTAQGQALDTVTLLRVQRRK